ncbi:hypothetical protein RHMOL_Rhmol12G0188400 [Rhododendron molle]|uniref:Uncharacterized protein n=1 Tax=Rhododendron molle TaxID=49168 RepID=A0ACC0LJR8_RHOML|nr:hypothetical protein RHMOL_Rhmol12G0188400 [Rhododendron molle]
MAGRSLVCGGGSNSTNPVWLRSERVSCCTEPLDSLFTSGSSSPSFLGSRSMFSFGNVTGGKRSMVSFEDNNGGKGTDGSLFHLFDPEEYIDEELDEYLHHNEKKRRLTPSQIKFLEKNFELDNKLEPERKIQLAKDIGLQPRQVAIWFQNRRARLKTNHLEKDYKELQASYNNLKANYDSILMEKEKLKAEVLQMTENLLFGLKERGNLESQPPPENPVEGSVSEDEVSKVSILACTDVMDSDSPGYNHAFSSSRFEPDQLDLSHDEEDNFSRNLVSEYIFPNIGYADCSEPSADSCSFGFPVEDQSFVLWS